MSSGKDIAYESSYYYQEKEDYPDGSCFFLEVGAVVEATADVHVDADEEEGCTISMNVTNKSSVVYISANVSNR